MAEHNNPLVLIPYCFTFVLIVSGTRLIPKCYLNVADNLLDFKSEAGSLEAVSNASRWDYQQGEGGGVGGNETKFFFKNHTAQQCVEWETQISTCLVIFAYAHKPVTGQMFLFPHYT